MKKSSWLAPTLIVVGLLLILVSIWAPQQSTKFGFSQNYISTLIEKLGTVKIQNSEVSGFTDVKINQKIKKKTILRTEADSESLIEFKNGGQFRLPEKSEILIDTLENGAPVVVIRNGDIYIEKLGEAPSFWIRADGQIYLAADYAILDKKRASYLKESSSEQTSKGHLSQIEIENTLSLKKNDFFKCYGQLIQKDPQATGLVLISFTIENHGKPKKVVISKSDIQDKNFQSCLQEVVVRSQFRNFSGTPVTTVFPLKFE